MGEPLFRLVKGEERHAVHVRALGLCVQGFSLWWELAVEPIPYGDGDGFAVLVTLPSGRCLSVDRDSDRCLTVERDMHRKYRTQREVDAAVRYWRGVFGLGVST